MDSPHQGAQSYLIMSRTLRQNLPGAAFHITARTHRKEPWFQNGDLYDPIYEIIQEGIQSSDARLMAAAVMPNHFHIVLRQGRRPLGWIMQGIMRRIAIRVQKRFGFQGHVFEREYRSRHCNTPDHLRRSIVYTNINPHRANLCDGSGFYRWTTHTRYIMDEVNNTVAGIELAFALPLFGDEPDLSMEELRHCYIRYVEWRLAKDACDLAGDIYDVPEPGASCGDDYFVANFLAAARADTTPSQDLRDRALSILMRIDAHMEISQVRRSYGPRHITQVRNEVIAGLIQSGYRVKCIADFLNVSDATVSTIASKMRHVAVS